MTNIFPIDFEEKLTMAQDDYILFSDSEDGNKIKKAQYKNLKGEPGTPGQDGEDGAAATITVGSTTTGAAGSSASVTNVGTSSAAILDFTIPQGAKGEPGEDGQDGADGAAATITAGTTTTLSPGSSATVTNSGTSSAAVFNFGIPQGATGATGNGIASITSSKAGKTTTVTITETNGTVDTFQVQDGEDISGGDVVGPSSSTDGDIAVFDGATGKLIKDGGTTISGITSSISTNTTAISTINGKIPSAATSSNQLADKDYVNDGINSVTAYYITKNAQGDQWATRAELFAATTFYSGGVVRVPTKNDYTIVLADEQHDNATTRYIYNSGWEYQYTVNETALTQAQLDALNSGITAAKVSTYDGLNIKAFYLSDGGDLTNAQAAYDWYLAGKNPIIVLNKLTYYSSYFYSSTNKLGFVSFDGTYPTGGKYMTLSFSVSDGNVSSISNGTTTLNDYYLCKTNTTSYTPTSDYNPATKKYVDDSVSVVSGDSGVTYTIKVSNSDPTSGTASNIITLVP